MCTIAIDNQTEHDTDDIRRLLRTALKHAHETHLDACGDLRLRMTVTMKRGSTVQFLRRVGTVAPTHSTETLRALTARVRHFDLRLPHRPLKPMQCAWIARAMVFYVLLYHRRDGSLGPNYTARADFPSWLGGTPEPKCPSCGYALDRLEHPEVPGKDGLCAACGKTYAMPPAEPTTGASAPLVVRYQGRAHDAPPPAKLEADVVAARRSAGTRRAVAHRAELAVKRLARAETDLVTAERRLERCQKRLAAAKQKVHYYQSRGTLPRDKDKT